MGCKCETFHLKMSSLRSFFFMQVKVIFIRMVSHLDSLWNRGARELGNGLYWSMIKFTFCINKTRLGGVFLWAIQGICVINRSPLNSRIFLVYMRTGIFFARGGGEPFAQKILSRCPNYNETVERKRGSYDALTMAYIWSENIFTYKIHRIDHSPALPPSISETVM